MTNPVSSLSNFLALLLSAAVIYAIYYDVRNDIRRVIRARNVVLAGILIWYMLEAILRKSTLESFTQREYNFGVICVALATVSFLAVYHYWPQPRFLDPVGERLRALDDPEFLWKLVMVGSIIGFLPVIVVSGGDLLDVVKNSFGFRSGEYALARGRYGGAREAFLELQMFARGVAPFAFILLLKRDTPIVRKLLCAFLVLWPVIRAFGSGARHPLFLAVLPYLAVVFWKASPRVQKRLVIFGSIPLILLAYIYSAVMVVARNTGEFSSVDAREVDYVGYEMFSPLLIILARIPGEGGYLLGYSYYVQLVNPIPRAIWPGKPTLETGLMLARMVGAVDEQTGDTFLTYSPGLIGEMYFNFGIVGIIALSGLGGWLVAGWDRLLDRFGDSLGVKLVFASGAAVLFFLGRSLNLPVMYGLLALFALLAILNPAPVRKPVLAVGK